MGQPDEIGSVAPPGSEYPCCAAEFVSALRDTFTSKPSQGGRSATAFAGESKLLLRGVQRGRHIFFVFFQIPAWDLCLGGDESRDGERASVIWNRDQISKSRSR